MSGYKTPEPIFGVDISTIPLSGADLDAAVDICAVADWWDKRWSESQLREIGDVWGATLAEVRDALTLHYEAMRDSLPHANSRKEARLRQMKIPCFPALG